MYEGDPSIKRESLIQPESVYFAMISPDGSHVDAVINKELWQELSFEQRILLKIGNTGDGGYDTRNNVIDVISADVDAHTLQEKEQIREILRAKMTTSGDGTIKSLREVGKDATVRLMLSDAGKSEVIELLKEHNYPNGNIT